MDNTKVIKEEKTVAFRERKRILFFGLPFTFTVYTVSNVVVTVDTGFFNREENDCYMYKIQDVTLKRSLFERMFGLGTIICYTGDVTNPELVPEDVKTQKCSISDPESGWFRKGEHKHVFAYAVETACDKHGWILGYTVHPGNEHDSRTFKALYDKISKLNPQMVVADAGYKTPAIAHQLLEDGIQPLFPYTRPKTKEGFFGKHEFAYDEYYDCYICPGAHILTYSTTNRSGYKEYKSCGEHCAECQCLSKCTESKDHVKLITRHVWEEYMEVVEDIRHTIGNRQIYQLRKETIERIFGTAKEQHGFRYTQYVGKARMEMKAGLTFACMNLKKLAKILEKRSWNTARFLLILKKIKRKEVLKEKWCWA